MAKIPGWRKEPARHALAAKGIKTKNRLAQSQLDRIHRGGAIRSTVGRRTGYNSTLRGLARKYMPKEGAEEDPLAGLTENDYEKAVRPLFDSLADADELVDRGELKASINMIKLAQDQYESMTEKFNVIEDADTAQFEPAVARITEKNVAGSRQKMAAEASKPDQAASPAPVAVRRSGL